MKHGLRLGGNRRRRLHLVNQYFWPDVAATSQLLTDLAHDAAAAGWDVRVLTGATPYASGSPWRGPRRERVGGVTVERLPGWTGGSRLVGRGGAYLAFLVRALPHALRWRRGDVVVALSTPPFVALLGWLAQRRGARFVYKVEDLYPDVALALGVLRRGPLASALAWLSRRLLEAADAVVVLEEGMRRTVAQRRGTTDGLVVIPNWADEAAVLPASPQTSAVRQSLGLAPGTLLVGYAGNFGRAHRFDALLEAAALAAEKGLPLHFLFSGGGPHAGDIRQAAMRLRNVTVRGYVARDQLGDLLCACDVQIVSLRPEVEGLLFPSKLAGILAAARPVLALGAPTGSLAREVRGARIGWLAEHEPGAILGALEAIVAERAALPALGARARAWFEARYTRRAARSAWLALLEHVTLV